MYTILLVDDSPVMRHFVSRSLEMTGLDLSIHQAEDGRRALESAQILRPDLIITDLNMPEMNGEQLLKEVSEHEILRSTPVIILSADGGSGRTSGLLQSGAAAYLRKPVKPEELKFHLLRILQADSGETQ